MIYTETLSTVILSVCNSIFSTNKETFASFGKMFNESLLQHKDLSIFIYNFLLNFWLY